MQIEIVNLNDLVKKNHPYRTLLSIIDFSGLTKNTAAKLFCNFSLISQTPDHSLFSRLRQSIDTNDLGSIFNKDIFL